ncbi:MAG TPA: RodZ domain-containing protein [Candidatus Binatia bacterium]|nr:RodZ domain-containing protein [Candidatus Binatia bacterium]
MGAFGEKLRRQREQRGLELEAISSTTKISTRMLRALEDEHFDQLPGGVFNKGFVRAYARQVGLNEEETVADYLAALRENQVQQQAILPDFRNASKTRPPAPPIDQNRDTIHTPSIADLPGENPNGQGALAQPSHSTIEKEVPPAPPSAAASEQSFSQESRTDLRSEDRRRGDRRRPAATIPLDDSTPPPPDDSDAHALGMMGPYLQSEPAESNTEPTRGTGAQVPWRQLAAALFAIVVALAIWNLARHRDSASAAHAVTPATSTAPPPQPQAATTPPNPAAASPEAKASAPASTIKTPSASPIQKPLTTAAATSSAATEDVSALGSDVTVRQIHPRAATPSSFSLVIRAEKTSWISITADGKPVAQETLIAPANTSVRATREIVVRTGNAAGVSFFLNGKEIPANGNEGEAKTYTFDATGLRAPSQPNP